MNLQKYVFVLFLFLVSALSSTQVQAADVQARWTQQYGMTDDLHAILTKLNPQVGLNLTYDDFQVFERRDLARFRFTMYRQQLRGVAIRGASIRTWVDLKTGHLVQMEASLDNGQLNSLRLRKLQRWSFTASNLDTMAYVRKALKNHPSDRRIGNVEWQDQWDGNDLQQVITVRARRGTHTIVVSYMTRQIVSTRYEEFPKIDVPASVYPIYEEAEKTPGLQNRVSAMLKNILPYRKQAEADPYAILRNRRYYEDKMDTEKGLTPDGQMQGFWSMPWLLLQAQGLYSSLPWVENKFEDQGLFLMGQYATINWHPDAQNMKGFNFPRRPSGIFHLSWKSTLENGEEAWEVVPQSALHGQPLADASSALQRNARRLPNHDPLTYMQDGFDEIQVYYAIDRMMEFLRGSGFADPELSTRPFHAFLYDPDISMRDNAYYTNDTINFTTYSDKNQNYARDNSTIWHELGHGVMDRLMGDLIHLADSGGLSEGMADFIAALVVQDVSQGVPFPGSDDFRINNQVGFNLTNESHDDGEAYGGAMKDVLDLVLAQSGPSGLRKMTDVTLDAMRLARNHPALTANDWFDHMLFADELGHAGVRAPGEMRLMILKALQNRNFSMNRGNVAQFTIKTNGSELTNVSQGSRGKPYVVQLSPGQEAEYQLTAQVTESAAYTFRFPLRLEISYNGGPLQGPVHWRGETNTPVVYTLNTKEDLVNFKVAAQAKCDAVNNEDGSCSDFVYMQLYNNGEARPFAKKRFYVRVTN